MSKKHGLRKKLSSRYIKYLFFNVLTNNTYLAKKFNLVQETISHREIKGETIECKTYNNQDYFVIKRVPNAILHENTGSSLLQHDSKLALISLKQTKVPRNYIRAFKQSQTISIDTPVVNLIGFNKGHKHFFHIFFDYAIPLYYFLKTHYQNGNLIILVRNDLSKVQQEVFNAIKTEFPKVKFQQISKNSIIHAKQLIFIKHYHPFFYEKNINSDLCDLVSKFRLMIIKYFNFNDTQNKTNNLLYISRSKTKLRRLINEKFLRKKLLKQNFNIVHAENISFKEQINCFLNANIIVATHGAGLTNLLFSRTNTKVLEIFPKKYGSKDFKRICEIRDLNYHKLRANNELLWQHFYLKSNIICEHINSLTKNEN